MKVITKEEADKLSYVYKAEKANKCIEAIKNLEVDQSLIIEKADWEPKTSPVVMISSYRKEGKIKGTFRTKTLTDEVGWVVTRLD